MFTSIYVKSAVFIAILIGSATLIFVARVPLAEALIPWLKIVVNLLEQRFDIGEFTITHPRQEYLFHLRLITDGPVSVYGYSFPRMDVSASTLITHALQHMFIFISITSASLLFARPRYGFLLIASCMGLMISLSLDIPFTLLGSIEGVMLQNLAPDQLSSHWLVKWEQFLTNGGRLSIALGLGLFCAVLTGQRTGELKSVNQAD
jgi:hypothetical protein